MIFTSYLHVVIFHGKLNQQTSLIEHLKKRFEQYFETYSVEIWCAVVRRSYDLSSNE